MQFVTDGPDIPDSLLQAHEEGRVVFFCGAGISYPAGLPDFGGLVEQIYSNLGTRRKPIEDKAFSSWQYDATLNLLEDRLPGQRKGLRMRKALAECLKPKLRRQGATDTHAALLQLARNREGRLRLVTTNFDRVFEHVGARLKVKFDSHLAPMLPVPKNSRWDGLVYLHGLLTRNPDESTLNRLVVTSGDFGLAYLTERWAARFVSELFRNYVVCFVGYSINDPVMRYMMDALAADRMLGEITPQAWALGSFTPGNEEEKSLEWRAKGVSPILYKAAAGDTKHILLHKTLKAWAETYRDGVTAKSGLVALHALARPSLSTAQDDFVGRMLWALSDKSGKPAESFADFNPVPSLDWLFEAFVNERFRHSDLQRFNVACSVEEDPKLSFSLVKRPSPYHLSARMSLVSVGNSGGGWDEVMHHLARWLTRHLNDPALVLWLADGGGHLGPGWSWLVERKLDQIDELVSGAKVAELAVLRANAPNAIPSPPMRLLWRLLLTGRVRTQRTSTDLRLWHRKLRRDGLSTTLRFELRDLLSPRVALREPVRWGQESDTDESNLSLNQLVDWELVLVSDHVHSALGDVSSDTWRMALTHLVDDVQFLLRDALDLLRELGAADNESDRSHWGLPSISAHRQNKGFRDWVALIEILRDAWIETRKTDPERASSIAQLWFLQPYATFKRLALFAASFNDSIDQSKWLEWLTVQDAWWLWSIETRREAISLLRLQGPLLRPESLISLEAVILAGPPRRMFPGVTTPEEWEEFKDRAVWLRLSKLRSVGVQLNQKSASKLDEISALHPLWRVAADERDEFSHWTSGTGDPDYKQDLVIDQAPTKAEQLFIWLKKPSQEDSLFHEDTWRQTCRNYMLNSLCALRRMAEEGLWPIARWREALQAWGEKNRVRRSWRYAANLVLDMPHDTLTTLAHQVAWWLREVSSTTTSDEERLFRLCKRVLDLDLEPDTNITINEEPIDHPVTEAINHPMGHVTQALLNKWMQNDLNDNDGLPSELKSVLTMVCDTRVRRFRHGRVILSANLLTLFRVDRPWAESHLIPLLDWTRSNTEARAAWEGFLWSPRLYLPLMLVLKPAFLQTASHYRELGDHARQFSAFITYAALEPLEGYSLEEFQLAFEAFPVEALHEAAQAMSQAIEGAGDQRESYWTNRVSPFWKHVWPKSGNLVSPIISEDLARVAIAAGDQFPNALATLEDWILPFEHPSFIVSRLKESGHCKKFGREALTLLAAIMSDQPWGWEDVQSCLDEIKLHNSEITKDPRYLRLINNIR